MDTCSETATTCTSLASLTSSDAQHFCKQGTGILHCMCISACKSIMSCMTALILVYPDFGFNLWLELLLHVCTCACTWLCSSLYSTGFCFCPWIKASLAMRYVCTGERVYAGDQSKTDMCSVQQKCSLLIKWSGSTQSKRQAQQTLQWHYAVFHSRAITR